MKAGLATEQARTFAARGVTGATAINGGLADLGLGAPLAPERVAAEARFSAPKRSVAPTASM